MRRLQPQFPLRTLLTLVLAVACYLGGRVSRDQELAEARAEIQRLHDARSLVVADLEEFSDCDWCFDGWDSVPQGLSVPSLAPPTENLPEIAIVLEDNAILQETLISIP